MDLMASEGQHHAINNHVLKRIWLVSSPQKNVKVITIFVALERERTV
jgi:hypothetical protein